MINNNVSYDTIITVCAVKESLTVTDLNSDSRSNRPYFNIANILKKHGYYEFIVAAWGAWQ